MHNNRQALLLDPSSRREPLPVGRTQELQPFLVLGETDLFLKAGGQPQRPPGAILGLGKAPGSKRWEKHSKLTADNEAWGTGTQMALPAGAAQPEGLPLFSASLWQ